MKIRIFISALPLLFSIASHAQSCNDAFAYTGAINGSWTVLGGTLNAFSGKVSSATVGGGGYAVCTGGGAIANDQYMTTTIAGAIDNAGATWVAIRMSSTGGGSGYFWTPGNGQISKLTSGGYGGAVTSSCPATSTGDTIMFSAYGTTLTCTDVTTGGTFSVTDSSYSSGYGGISINADVGPGTDAFGPFTSGSYAPAAATPTYSPVAGRYSTAQTVTLSTATTGDGCTLVWNTTNAQSGGNLTGTSTTNPLTVSTSETVYAQAQGCTSHSNSLIASAQYIIGAATWFIRTDGGTRYSSNATSGQCDGLADVAYPGTGINQHCAFRDFRYTFDDGSYGNFAWLPIGGDTVVIRGCHAASDQQNPSDPNCRIGWDLATGPGTSGWCNGSNPNTNCFNPAIPAGTSGAHTKILGGCAYDGTCNPVSAYPYTSNNLTQLFGGFGTGTVLNLSGTTYVDVAGLEITAHNGACSRRGTPAYPADCSTSSPVSDYATQGISTGDTAGHITFTDVYVHGMNESGFFGSIGGPITMTRAISAFNAFAGWNFDDGNPDGTGSSITASYVWMEGNGCQEQYPITNTSFPAVSCHDTNSGGFGDSWSGQGANMDAFSCDHCTTIYNTKDGFIGPHTLIKNLSLTHSQWYGNMGSQLKWGTQDTGSTLFQNNFVNGNCYAMSVQIPGAAQNFNQSTSLGGSYLTGYCRAAGAPFAISTGANATFLFAGNTIVENIAQTTLQMSCVTVGTCSTTTWQYTDNIFLGYSVPSSYGPFGGGYVPAIYYTDDTPSTDMVVNSTHNLFYGNRVDDCSGGYGSVTLTITSPICADPLLAGEPASYSGESVFFPFIPSTSNLQFTGSSTGIHAGVAVSGLTNDYYGVSRPNPPSVGFAEYVTGGGGVVLGGGVILGGGVVLP